MDGNLNSKMHFFLALGKMPYPTSNIKDGILLFNCKQRKHTARAEFLERSVFVTINLSERIKDLILMRLGSVCITFPFFNPCG